jgi:hypothetical protein
LRGPPTPQCPLLDFALEVEQVTTSKKPNLILNVDGVIGVVFVDLMRHSGLFTKEVLRPACIICPPRCAGKQALVFVFVGLADRALRRACYQPP